MKRCPKCNRVYPTNTQRFCTHDGGLLVVDETPPPAPAIPEDDSEATKMISRELLPDAGKFDPFKTTLEDPLDRDRPTQVIGTSELPTQAAPQSPPQRSAPPPPPPVSQQLGETTSPSMRPAPPPTSAPLPPAPSERIGEITSPSIRPVAAPQIPAPSPPPAERPAPPTPPAPAPAQQVSGGLPSTGSGPIAAPAGFSSAPLQSPAFTGAAQAQPVQPLTAAQAKKKSKLALILGILAVLLVLGLGVLGVGYIFVFKPMLEARGIIVTPSESPQQPVEAPANVNTAPVPQETTTTPAENVPPPVTPPENATQFVNSNDRLDGKLAEHYVDFSFYYPEKWQKDPKSGVAGASNFAKVERRLPPDFTQENFAVGWYSSSGSLQDDQSLSHSLAENLSSQFEKNFPEYRKVSEGATRVGIYDGYEFRFEGLSRNTAKGDLKLWGRVVFLPPANGGKSGVTLLMLATSLAPELEGVSDVGEKGQLPMILETFRFGRPASSP